MSSYLITGGSRSGKSRYALSLAKSAKTPFYIATGWAGDDEMAERIEKHRKEREKRWTTIETRTDIPKAIDKAVKSGADFILLDCLTLWVSNLMMENKNIDDALESLVNAIPKIPLVIVTNELGSGIVPDNKLSRKFRDNCGFVNQRIAAVVDNVILMVCGLPMKLKGIPKIGE